MLSLCSSNEACVASRWRWLVKKEEACERPTTRRYRGQLRVNPDTRLAYYAIGLLKTLPAPGAQPSGICHYSLHTSSSLHSLVESFESEEAAIY